jgi:hypothetical protein
MQCTEMCSDKKFLKLGTIHQSCQVQMIKNLEVVGAFSAKKFFPEKIIFDAPPPAKKISVSVPF